MNLSEQEKELIRLAINNVNWPGAVVEQVADLKKKFPLPVEKKDDKTKD